MSQVLKLGLPLTVSLFLLTAGEARAAIQKCKSASGEVTYTQHDCPPGTTPVALPDSVPDNTRSSFRSSTANSRYSSRAPWLEKLSMRELQMLHRECALDRLRRLTLCAPINEAWSERTALLDRRAAELREERNAQCAAGDQAACENFTCSQVKPSALTRPYMIYAGTDAEVRECSRDRRFPSSPQWAQLSETAEAGVFVCLPRLDLRNEHGELMAFRAVLMVGPQRSPSGKLGVGFTTPVLKGEVFPSMSEALNAGCQELVTNAPNWRMPASRVTTIRM